MTDWFTEDYRGEYRTSIRVDRTLHRSESAFQTIDVFEAPYFGKVLALGGFFQTSTADEHHYHEMIVHPAMVIAPRIRRVLVIGGGDGGTAREVLRYPGVERCVMVEIDRAVVDACRAHMPELSAGAFDDPRLELRFEDGVRYVAEADVAPFDVLILDGSDPLGPSEGLFDRAFYEGCRRVLAPDGIFATQSESPGDFDDVFTDIVRTLGDVFGVARPLFGAVPLYGSGLWSWTLASSELDLAPRPGRMAIAERTSRYYNRDIHAAAFAQPTFVRELFRSS